MTIYSGDESSIGETNSMYQLEDGRLGGYSDGDSIPDPNEPPNRVAIFMAGTQSVLNSSTAAAMTSGSTAAASNSARPPAQILSELLEALATLLAAEVTPENQAQHKVDVAKLRDEIAQAKEEFNAENTRMATKRAALDAASQRIQAENFWLSLDQNASNAVLRRRHQSRLPPEYDAMNLFNTPGAGTSDPPVVNRVVEAPGTEATVQPHAADPPRLNLTLPQHVPTPSGHYSNPLDNMIAAATRLATLPVEGESPATMEIRRAGELLQIAVAQ
jgi:hypothetical protein